MAMTRTGLVLLASSLGLVACKKSAEQQPSEPPAGDPKAAESRVDPRLASPDGADGGAADPHAGIDPHGGTPDPHGGAPDPHGGAPDPHGGGMAGASGGGGRVAEKTPDGRAILGPVTALVPKGWQEKPTSSGMRTAQWMVPGKAGEAELVVYYFGPGGAGGADANLERWIGQFEQPDGSPSASKAKTAKKTVGALAVTTVEVTGRYVAAMSPGAPEKNDKPDHMLLGAIVETMNGPYYFKMVGPKETMTGAKKQFTAFIDSLKPGAK
ncbi:MAG TPA: hypothetical protein VK698_24700 [Kofleriaceae bacterium]|nr:hypothetical protein [Kofleriaceae bacterium]